MTFSEYLKNKIDNGCTISQISRDTGIARSRISAYARGTRPRIDVLNILCGYFGIECELTVKEK